MANDMIDQWNKLGSGTAAAWKQLAELNAAVAEKFTKQQQALLNQCLEASSKQLNLATESKDYRELFAAQAELISEQSKKFVELTQQSAQTLEESRAELNAWAEKALKEFWEPAAKATREKKVA